MAAGNLNATRVRGGGALRLSRSTTLLVRIRAQCAYSFYWPLCNPPVSGGRHGGPAAQLAGGEAPLRIGRTSSARPFRMPPNVSQYKGVPLGQPIGGDQPLHLVLLLQHGDQVRHGKRAHLIRKIVNAGQLWIRAVRHKGIVEPDDRPALRSASIAPAARMSSAVTTQSKSRPRCSACSMISLECETQ